MLWVLDLGRSAEGLGSLLNLKKPSLIMEELQSRVRGRMKHEAAMPHLGTHDDAANLMKSCTYAIKP